MRTLQSYALGRWITGDGERATLYNPTNEEAVAELASGGFETRAVLDHARQQGVPALAKLSFAERGEKLKALSAAIHEQRDELIQLAVENGGNTRGDAKFDIDGAIGTLAAYAEWAKALPARPFLADGEGVQLSRTPRFWGQHVYFPRRGAALHINAFNFPAWGMMEKMACALCAGVPVIEKPGTPTALVAWRIAQIVVERGLLPEGSYQFIVGNVGDMLDHMEAQDVLAFTGSSKTAQRLRANANLVRHSVRVNVEADSLNAAVLAPDVESGSPTYGLFLANVVLDMTQKAGQKCTAVRRILVPSTRAAEVRADLVQELARTKLGDPADGATRLGPLASRTQRDDVRRGIERLAGAAEIATGGVEAPQPRGWFVAATLLAARDANAPVFHDEEVFGPVASILPYSGDASEAARLVARGGGGLVCSVYANDAAWTERFVMEAAPWHGRIWIASDKVADQSLPPGMVLPALVHGGPGRAGGGEELGGLRGVQFYMQRTALQGFKGHLESVYRA